MSELRNRVGQHTKLPTKNNRNPLAAVIPKINTQSIFFYAAPPVILMIILIIMRPGFVCTEDVDKENKSTVKLNFKKLLIAGLIGGTVISVGLFAYFRQTKKNLI